MQVDAETLRQAQRGEPAAQAAFLKACLGPVRALVRRLAGAEEVDDRLQEVLAHLVRVLPQFDPDGPAQLGTWVHTVTYRLMLMHKRKRHLELVPLEDARQVADGAPSAERALERRELQGLVERAVEALPEPQRRMFVAAHLHQVPLQEIAAAEGLPVGTVKSRLHRAKAELVLRLGAALDEGSQEGGGHVAHG